MQDCYQDVVLALGNPTDLVVYQLPPQYGESAVCLFIETLVDRDKIERLILRSLLAANRTGEQSQPKLDLAGIKNLIPIPDITEAKDTDACINGLLNGQCLLTFGEASNACFLLDVLKVNHRSISEPKTEATIRGPREGFTEALMINISLVRKRIKNPALRLESYQIGESTSTQVVLLYLENLASNDIVGEFRTRIQSIHTDSILESAYLEEWMQGGDASPFPTMLNTERPDIVAANILEGRIAVFTDGTPMVLIGPVTFFQFFSSPEDYYQKAGIATLIRFVRFVSFLLACFTPALYIAVITFHQALLPTSLLISLSAQREGVPFPGFVEALLMQLVFEILREAGLRMPRIAGQAISIVGALVIGQAAVEAGLVSAAMVIVVSLTAIANFVTPIYTFGIAQRLIQFGFMLLAGFMGLFGILCGVLFVLLYLASLHSFSVPYLSPFAPTTVSDWKDTLIRAPLQRMRTFPAAMQTKRKNR
ncbi:spore germination protein [Paenibacillus sp. R14(2021)]|uniref:spore germination protein n=1 Tax=Paenibacillus sp. R14(2021) TaxID=2859228 RepID=UPI001C61691E|nr:spore germination protein [Paenibacillus sp. R14(2021)]